MIVSYALLVGFAVFYLLPVYVLLVTGLKPLPEVNLEHMWSLPTTITLDGFRAAWVKLEPNLRNSVILVLPATILSTVLGSINGYILSKWRFRGSDVLFTLLLLGMFIPYQSILIPLIQFLEQIKLYGTIWGLVLVHVVYGLPICSLIFRNFFANIPGELVEAARIISLRVAGQRRVVVLHQLLVGRPDARIGVHQPALAARDDLVVLRNAGLEQDLGIIRPAQVAGNVGDGRLDSLERGN